MYIPKEWKTITRGRGHNFIYHIDELGCMCTTGFGVDAYKKNGVTIIKLEPSFSYDITEDIIIANDGPKEVEINENGVELKNNLEDH